MASQSAHPLDPLTPEEIAAITLAVREHWTIVGLKECEPPKPIKFITCYLLPPPKRAVLAYLNILAAEGESGVPIVRKAEVDFIESDTGRGYNATLSLKGSKWIVETLDHLKDQHPLITPEELVECEKIIQKDERVRSLAMDVGIKPEQIRADGWSIGYDDRFPSTKRLQQGCMFARLSEHENLYAHPLDFMPVVDGCAGEVLHVDFPPHYKPKGPNGGVPVLSNGTTEIPPLTTDSLASSVRERIPPPLAPFDFLPDLMARSDATYVQRQVKPLHVVQPEGVGFTVNGHVLEWQKWSMHIAFSHREGIALSTITYDDNGQVRPIFYRLSLAEMVVPYAAPEFPHARKFAFDVGEYGMGTLATELNLGCDCLGRIHYLPGAYVAHDGSSVVIKNAICIHEEDAGILWKHKDFRPGGRSQTVRSRRLVISMVCTVANYGPSIVLVLSDLDIKFAPEYVFNYQFYQDGSMELEIRLTGIPLVYVSQEGEPNPYGVTIAPRINAHHHQHIFSVRVDPMIDGLHNSVVETDVIPLPEATAGSKANFAGNAFVVQETVLRCQSEGAREYDFEKDRRWRVVNPSRQHYSSGHAVGYSVSAKGGAVRLLAGEGGWAWKRARFATKALWVVKDVESEKGGRLWPAGKYVPQTRNEPEDSVSRWVQGEDSIENEDIVLFITIGTTHIPRPEDWPVMPAEHLRLMFKPNHFFATNPSMDVPGTRDAQSVAAFPNKKSEASHSG